MNFVRSGRDQWKGKGSAKWYHGSRGCFVTICDVVMLKSFDVAYRDGATRHDGVVSST